MSSRTLCPTMYVKVDTAVLCASYETWSPTLSGGYKFRCYIVVFCQYQPTDALNKIRFMTGIETSKCFATVATSSVAFFVRTASGRQPAIATGPYTE